MTRTKDNIICLDQYGKKYNVLKRNLILTARVYGLLFQGNKILLSKQWGDGYDFPGGGINTGETIAEALKREFWEETGLRIKPGKLVGCFDAFYFSLIRKKPSQNVMLYYLCQKVSGQLSIKNIDKKESIYIDMPEWIDLKDVNKLKFYNFVDSVKIIKEARKL